MHLHKSMELMVLNKKQNSELAFKNYTFWVLMDQLEYWMSSDLKNAAFIPYDVPREKESVNSLWL